MVHEWPTAENKGGRKDGRARLSYDPLTCSGDQERTRRKCDRGKSKDPSRVLSRDKAQLLTQNSHLLQSLCRLDFITVMESGERPTNALFLKVEDIEVYLPLGMLKIEGGASTFGRRDRTHPNFYENHNHATG